MVHNDYKGQTDLRYDPPLGMDLAINARFGRLQAKYKPGKQVRVEFTLTLENKEDPSSVWSKEDEAIEEAYARAGVSTSEPGYDMKGGPTVTDKDGVVEEFEEDWF